jgi:hypothetical protein
LRTASVPIKLNSPRNPFSTFFGMTEAFSMKK